MEESKQMLTLGELKKTYLANLPSNFTGLNEDVISAGLKKHGVPEDLAKQFAKDVMRERRIEYSKQTRPVYKFCFD